MRATASALRASAASPYTVSVGTATGCPAAINAAASAIALLALGACSNDQSAGNQTARAGIWAAGSSTVFPFATRVAENFARTSGGAAPRVESLGTGGGIQAFCQGVGPNTPDIANASRPMKASEFELCRTNGVTDIVEIKIGFDGIVVATARNGEFVPAGLRAGTPIQDGDRIEVLAPMQGG